MKYVVGSPVCGPFTTPKEFEDEHAAIKHAERNYGGVLDMMDWQEEDGTPVIMLVVADK